MVQLAENKVIDLFQSDLSENVESFLTSKELRSQSEDTRLSYESDLRDFFNFLQPNRNMKSLKIKDVQLKIDTILKYQHYLKVERELASSTINRRVTTIKGLYSMLQRRGYVDNLYPFDEAQRLSEKQNHHGVLTTEEVLEMIEVVMNQPRARKKNTKKYLIQTAYDTCLRKSALLNIKFTDFVPYTKNGKEEYEIKAVDKGNESMNRIISKELYENLMSLRSESNSEYVFDITESSIQSMMDYIRQEMNVHELRNIVFHSIRKAGVTFQYNKTGDVFKAQKAAGHKNVNTTQLYVATDENTIRGGISSDIGIDDNSYKQLTHEELLQVIDSMTQDQKFMLNLKCRELMSKVVE